MVLLPAFRRRGGLSCMTLALAGRARPPKDRPVPLYCNSGSLSAQAGFALRVADWDNVRILRRGCDEWRARGRFDATERATGQPARH